MRKLVLVVLLSGVTAFACAQGFICLDNTDNGSTNPNAPSGGLFWLSTGGTPVPIGHDFNAAFYGGADSNKLSLIATFLLSDGTATGDNAWGPGYFIDPTTKTYPVAPLPGSLSAFFEIQAWTGNHNSYAAAVAAGAPAAQSPVFLNPLNLPPGPPIDLISMPAMVLSVPEPEAFSLGALGGICALLLGRHRR